ncbi:MAG: N-acetyl-gamma-glutamyl-phosphate reductase [Planctomycetota bacterium]|nr:N-acetyl-gamma-glutamyl-phosphate reductase [Planctomycetota bacterium]
MIPVAVVGASGYAARELMGILARHPYADLVMATSRADESTRVDSLHPSLNRIVDLACEPFDADKLAEKARFAFLGLPHAASLAVVPKLRERGVRVIDLSADYRLKDAAVYADWYAHTHDDPAGLAEAVYGLPEIYRDQIPTANLIANPGCYTSTSILSLAPLVAEDLIDRRSVIIDAKSGVSGAGRSPKLTTHFPECNESFSAYGVGRHRHTPEIDQVLTDVGRLTGDPVEVLFTPHLVPMDRGILATIYATPKRDVTERELMELFRNYYADCPFVRVVDGLPATKDSAFTNFFDLTVRVVRGRILIVACLDNLLKGAAGVAVQNFNLMNGLDETLGLI